jgi:uncharacterized protein (TIGR02145 family)
MDRGFPATKPNVIILMGILTVSLVLYSFCQASAQEKTGATPNPSPQYRLGTQLVPDGDTTSVIFDHTPNSLVTSCSNSDFSEGTFSNWSGCYGGFSSPCDAVGFNPTRHVIMPRANQTYDPFIGAPLTTLFPGEEHSARLGDTLEGNHSEQLRYTVSVNPDHFLFIYRWAAVLESPDHDPWQMPKFSLQVEDMAGNPIGGPCGFYEFVAPNCGPPGPSCIVPPEWHYFPVISPAINLYWHDWTTIALDLSPFEVLGNVQIVFTTRGCALQIHRGYAYLSTYCGALANQIDMCAGAAQATLTAPPGFTGYEWRGPGLTGPVIGNTQSIIINNPQPNDMYYVNLTAANGCVVDDLSQEIRATVVNTEFNFTPHCAGEATTFLDASTINQNDVVYWHWIWGDGTLDLGGIPNPTHVYALPGTYTATLNAYSTEGCLGTISHPVTISAIPPPTLAGPATTCANGAGQTYTTEPGMTSYVWTFPPGTNVIAGGTSSSNTAILSWSNAGNNTIGVNYTNPLAVCNSISPASLTVTVGALSPPVITGDNQVCLGATGKTYTTAAGKTNYIWVIPPGATPTDGGTIADNFVTLMWNTVGIYNISVNYTEPVSLCSPATAATYPVTVTALQPPTFLSGEPGVCVGAGGKTYATQPGKVNYEWTIPPEAHLDDGGTNSDNFVILTWLSTGTYTLGVNYSEPVSLCTSALPATLDVTVVAWPGPAGNILGEDSVCRTTTVNYSVSAIPFATSFQWQYSGSGIVITNNGNATISIDFTSSATDGTLTVRGVNSCGEGTVSPPLFIIVLDIPAVSFTPCFDIVTTPNARKIVLRGGIPYIQGQSGFSGDRVSLNPATGLYEFDPQGASPGNYPITYSYTNTGGCMASAAPVSITVQKIRFNCGEDLTDVRDGKKYKTVLLSGHCWMKENLGYGMYLNSPGVVQTDNCIPEKYCSPADAGCTMYGGLYQWDELMDYSAAPSAKGICPPEWHVPSEAEWQYLIDNLVAGVPLARTNSTLGATLKYPFLNNGFLALMEGLDYNSSYWAFFEGGVTGTMFWTSTECSSTQAVARGLNVINPSISWYCSSRGNAFSQRCVKD